MVGYLVAYIQRQRGMEKEKDPYSPFRLWKWVTVLFQTALLWETVITIVFWLLLWGFGAHAGTFFHDFCDTSIVHLLPIIYLLIDYSLNRIYFEWNQVWIQMACFLAYGALNITVTKVSGHPVYGPMPWDSFGSWCIGLALLPFAFGVYTGFYFLTRWKFAKFKMDTNTVMFQSMFQRETTKENNNSLINSIENGP